MAHLHRLTIFLLTITLLASCGKGGSGTSSPAGGDKSPVSGAEEKAVPEDPVLAWIDGRPVTRSDLDGFASRHLGASHSDPHSPGGDEHAGNLDFAGTFQAYVRYRVLVDEGFRRDLAAGKEFEDWKTLRRLALLAPSYRAWARENAVIPPEKVKAAIPSRMVQMNLALKAFPTLEAAWEAKKGIASLEDFQGLPDGFGRSLEHSVSGRMAETGLIWPDSGFFGKADDGYLFTLEEGDLSDPVESGLGVTLCFVLTKKVYTSEEQAAYLETVRGQLADDYAMQEVRRVEEEGPYRIYRDVVKKIWEDAAYDASELDLTVMEFDGIPVTYRMAHFLQTFNYGYMKRMYPRDRFHEWVSGQLSGIAKKMSQGFEGEKVGVKHPEHLEDRLAVELDDFIYQRIQYLINSSYDPDLPPEEVRAFYEANRERFKTRDFITIDYYFSPFIGELDKALEMVRGGADFYELGGSLPRQEQAPHASSGEGPLKTGTYYRGGPGLTGVDEDLFRYREGEMDVLTSGMGEYLIRVKKVIEGRQLEFEEVEEAVKEQMRQRGQRGYLASVVNDLIKKANITFSSEGEKEIKGVPAKPFQETG